MRLSALSRRRFLLGSAGLVGATTLAGCDRLAATDSGRRILGSEEDANLYVQRLLLSKQQLAPEYREADISPWFKPNGTDDPPDGAYKALARDGFRKFQLDVEGLVAKSGSFSLDELRNMPSRTQITRHDCVEGWSCIGKWTGVPVSAILERVGLMPNARYVVFHCADTMEGGEAEQDDGDQTSNPQMERKQQATQTASGGSQGQSAGGSSDRQDAEASDQRSSPVRFYESIDLEDAYHPQTILAYDMNDKVLPVKHGAPLRLRLERQLGYKMAKYVIRLSVVASFDQIGQGKGGKTPWSMPSKRARRDTGQDIQSPGLVAPNLRAFSSHVTWTSPSPTQG